jgi:hypothetical protein
MEKLKSSRLSQVDVSDLQVLCSLKSYNLQLGQMLSEIFHIESQAVLGTMTLTADNFTFMSDRSTDAYSSGAPDPISDISRVPVRPFISLTCNSYLCLENGPCLVSKPFHKVELSVCCHVAFQVLIYRILLLMRKYSRANNERPSNTLSNPAYYEIQY